MPTAPEPKLDALIQDCSLSSAQACFRKLCPSGFKRVSAELENPDGERFNGFTQFGELPLNGDTLLFVYAETRSDLSQRSARKAQFDAARELLKARGEYDAGIFIYRGANGAFRLSLISKIYKGTKAEFSHFRRYTYFVDPRTDGNSTFIRQIGGCAFGSLEAIQEAFSVEAINKDFYRELSNWYFWAMKHVHFPTDDIALDKTDILADKEKVREHDAKNLIRLLTRMLFVWFIKQRDLVPHEFFDPEAIARDYLDGFDPQSRETHFYKAILQNLFFATLNQTKDKREFRKMGPAHRDNGSLMRYKSAFKEPQRFVDRVESITPFLNGGLFECLDFLHPTEKGPQGGRKKVYEDGFSDHPSNPLKVPDFLFFGEARTEDLSGDYGDKKRKKEPVQGLLHILNRYNFTIVENTPIEQEVALDPELLGKVFENLLASYNPETQTTARKQTGSFYTPRSIVDYMVDESLKAYLLKPLTEEAGMTEVDAKVGLELLFSYEEKEMDTCFNPEEVKVVIRAIDRCKILDPACGSGAFPMGTLQKLVYILGKLDPENEQWEAVQIDEARNIPDATERRERIRAIGQDFLDNGDDYGRKLYLIENCLYGVDIQSIATQVSKLRFFISLVVDQQIRPDRPNFGVRPLPNLETKFVTADTLIAIEKPAQQRELSDLTTLRKLQDALQEVRHKIFSVKQTETKQKYKDEDLALREQIAAELKLNGWHSDTADRLAAWDPYKQNNSADFFDPEWMFGLKGFDVVIGNPPYVQIKQSELSDEKREQYQAYESYQYKADLYHLFMEKMVDLLMPDGSAAVICPTVWMTLENCQPLRKYLLNNTDILSAKVWGEAVFTAAVVNTMTLVALKGRATKRVPIYTTNETFELSREYIENDKHLKINFKLSPAVRDVINRIEAGSIKLEELAEVTQGLTPYDKYKGHTPDQIKKRCFHADTKVDSTYGKWLNGRDISRWSVKHSGEWLRYGKWLGAPREGKYFKEAKVYCREVPGPGKRIQAAVHNEESYTGHAASPIIARDGKTETLHFITAVLNSSLLSWYASICSPNFSKDIFPKLNPSDIKKLPTPIVDDKQQKELADLAAKAAVAVINSEVSVLHEIEIDIDNFIFQLFDLDCETRKVIGL